jgi:hypothetical protein
MGVTLKPSSKPTTAKSDFDSHLVSAPITSHKSVVKKLMKSEVSNDVETSTIHKGVVNQQDKMMKLSLEGSHTLNLGNYESAKISIGLVVPCSMETLEESYTWGTDWIGQKLEEAAKEAKGES